MQMKTQFQKEKFIMEKCLATRYMKENRINGTITTITKYGFEYMTWNGECYYVPFTECRQKQDSV